MIPRPEAGVAEWIPPERAVVHPEQRGELRRLQTVGWCMLTAALAPGMVSEGVDPYFRAALVSLMAAMTYLYLAPRATPIERDGALFADLGEPDGDMTEVEVRLRLGRGLLGTDQGWLWRDEGATAFHGARFSFRLPADEMPPVWGVRELSVERSEGTTMEIVALGTRAFSTAQQGSGAGRLTAPPSERDPYLVPPSRREAWSASAPGLTALAGFATLWALGPERSLYLLPVLFAGVTATAWPWVRWWGWRSGSVG